MVNNVFFCDHFVWGYVYERMYVGFAMCLYLVQVSNALHWLEHCCCINVVEVRNVFARILYGMGSYCV